MGFGFWLDPKNGDVILVDKHINAILDHPEVFGFTREELQSIYDKYGERYRREGNAREEILKMLIDKGWIRVRKYYGRMHRITINVPELSRDIKDTLVVFAMRLLNGVEISGNGWKEKIKEYPDTVVIIADGEGNILLKTTLGELAEGKFEGTYSALSSRVYSRLGLEKKLRFIHQYLLSEERYIHNVNGGNDG